jgi:dolichyl-phosphate-mannose--protein O-mannosyl transferase
VIIELLSGALVFAYLIAGLHFLRFWRRTGDRLFLHFALAFWLFALNQVATSLPIVTDEIAGYEYLLRVIGFILILVAIVEKNIARPPR